MRLSQVSAGGHTCVCAPGGKGEGGEAHGHACGDQGAPLPPDGCPGSPEELGWEGRTFGSPPVLAICPRCLALSALGWVSARWSLPRAGPLGCSVTSEIHYLGQRRGCSRCSQMICRRPSLPGGACSRLKDGPQRCSHPYPWKLKMLPYTEKGTLHRGVN